MNGAEEGAEDVDGEVGDERHVVLDYVLQQVVVVLSNLRVTLKKRVNVLTEEQGVTWKSSDGMLMKSLTKVVRAS